MVKKRILQGLFLLVCLYFVLLIPDSSKPVSLIETNGHPFTWNQDKFWEKLEHDFIVAKKMHPNQLDSVLDSLKNKAELIIAAIPADNISETDKFFKEAENVFFSLAPLIAVKTSALNWYLDYYNRIRNFVKFHSQYWDMKNLAVRNTIYRLLYGLRAAVEEVLIQADGKLINPVLLVKDERTITPAAQIFGIEVHSGDLLVSRGGAAVSALISRGNDFPGNFSHVALLYVDEKTGKAHLIEAHIEKGVAVSSVEEYEQDKKLRFMVMRPRQNLAALIADPMLPHKTAKMMFDESQNRHIPYDFKMNFYDSAAMFCSEVASYAYRKNGLQFWQPVSTISSPGIVNWLHDFGVTHFVTQMPSDLEYDPQLAVVAEWRDPETLFKDHIDNAVMDAMLERANAGASIDYNTWKLPLVRMIKGYCIIKNIFGKTGIIPEGMSATRALKNQSFVAMHHRIKLITEQKVKEFIKLKQYKPPYRQLVQFAIEASNRQQ